MPRYMTADDREQGVALITVLLVTLVLSTLAVGALGYSTGALNLSKRDQDWNAALAAAESGIDDYVFRLNQDDQYWRYSATNPKPGETNLALTASGFAPVAGPANDASFHYVPDATTLPTDGRIKLKVTGRVRAVQRSLNVILRRRNFLDYLYFTNYETKDPAAYVNPPDAYNPTNAETNCSDFRWVRASNCTNISFISRDRIRGPLHSNDSLLINGSPKFEGPTSTSWNDPAGKFWVDGAGTTSCPSADPCFIGGPITYKDVLPLPPSNKKIQYEADFTVGGTGCLYTGPTRITLRDTGKMDVVSPMTIKTGTGCGPGTNLSLPANGVVYVQSVPASPSPDPTGNYTAGCPYSSPAHPLGYPVSPDITTYGCRNGDAFVSGTLLGQLTIGTENNIVVTGDTVYKNGTSGTDVLGLVANNYVQVYHPVNSSGTNQSGSVTDLDINAAIVSLAHSFIVQNYNRGNPLGNLSVTGAIAQNYRGPVGTFSGSTISTGYAKNYVYDNRLKYLSPPHFIDPVESAWEPKVWSEVKN